ncbi:MAG: methyl-accepting chemotaxis protein [Oscillospiraceae bacterium]|nr:methyl-accepting chemotaxis protein [Oscillospiraceae bacterium]MDY2847185.1 methyl-accepting chemotaxis protein [Oscillospiraceae bacterium]
MKVSILVKFLCGAVLPILVLGGMIYYLAETTFRSSVLDQAKNAMRNTATCTLAAYETNSGEYYLAKNGDVWKGGYNISLSDNLIDNIAGDDGTVVTFFYGADRVMTSAKDADGRRLLDSPAGDKIVSEVLEGGNEYFSSSVYIDGTIYYGYYIPVYQDNGASPIGMVFAGQIKESVDRSINSLISKILVIVFVIAAAGMLLAVFVAMSVTGAINKGVNVLKELASGNLSAAIPQRVIRRRDEAGELARAVEELKNSLTDIISRLKSNSDSLIQASEILNSMAGRAMNTLGSFESAISDMTSGANKQAEDMNSAGSSVSVMSSVISTTTDEIAALNENSESMLRNSDTAAVNLKNLLDVNGRVRDAIDIIGKSTAQTDSSVSEISEAAKLVSDIAEETSILSINANIEAARAGEYGRGFAVVASQVRNLAVESTRCGKQIQELVERLTADSSLTMKTMKETRQIITDQSTSIENTAAAVNKVIEGIRSSADSIRIIEKHTGQLDNVRSDIVKMVDDLTVIAGSTAELSNRTSGEAAEMSSGFSEIGRYAAELKRIADELSQYVNIFRL